MERLRRIASSLFGRVGRPRRQFDIEAVKQAELRIILGARRTSGRKAKAKPVSEPELWGLALSGGGIRSATFALGALQTLARNELLRCFHYQSTVSGGGYIGAFLQALIRRRGFAEAFAVLSARQGAAARQAPGDAETWLQRPIRHLREYSNYLSPRKSPFSGDTLGMLGTYARNVLLIQIQLCALILALALAPLLLHAAAMAIVDRSSDVLYVAASVSGMAALGLLAYVTTSVNRRRAAVREPGERPPGRIGSASFLSIGLLGAAALLGAIGLAHAQALPAWIAPLADAPLNAVAWLWPRSASLPASFATRLGVAGAALYFLMWMAWLGVDRASALAMKRAASGSFSGRHALRFVLSSAAAAAFAGLAIAAVLSILQSGHVHPSAHDWHVIVLGPLLVLAGMLLVGILHMGLAGPALSDLQREIWARVGGKTTGVVAFGISLPLALLVYGPWAVGWAQRAVGVGLETAGWLGVGGWLATTGAGLLVGRGVQAGTGSGLRRRALRMAARLVLWVFVLGLVLLLAVAGMLALQAWAPPAGSRLFDAGDLGAYLARLDALVDGMGIGRVALFALAAFALWGLFGWAVDVNEFSLNAFYRNRLVRCYLGASNPDRNPEPTTNFDLEDDLPLAALVEGPGLEDPKGRRRDRGCRPLYPLIGTAMNMVATKQLDWQDRKAASFCLSPGFCGYLPPASRPQAHPVGDLRAASGGTAQAGHAKEHSLAASLTLGGAIAMSGAAVSPNMGSRSSPAVTFLLTLFDARLGWWLPNLNHAVPADPGSSPFFGRWLLAEILGRTRDDSRYVHLSDGGHFENLGLYELVRRRCRFVLCVDAAADPRQAFADLGNAVQKCRVDFGVEIRIDVGALKPGADGRAARSCAVGSIDYPDGASGTLLYLKPALTGEEPTDIQHYARTHPSFPHEPTSDQYFDEAQFESYRRLGQDVMARAIEPALLRIGAEAGSVGNEELGNVDSERKQRLSFALKQQWAPSPPGGRERHATHGQALSRLFARLRDTPALAVLDAQFYPAWIDLAPQAPSAAGSLPPTPEERRTRLPAPEDFRACFYFCQELVRLMESVYHDLDLEAAWDHPDNRGWMNAFRHWSWAPMFRIVWVMGMPTFGARFVSFCQQRLGMPRLDNHDKDAAKVLFVEERSPQGVDWQAHCLALAGSGAINHVECSMLTSRAMLQKDASPERLFLLRLRWKTILAPAAGPFVDTTLGIAAVAGDSLRMLRVQDHLNGLGLRTEFMRALVIDHKTAARVDVRGGHYGLAGIWRNRAARRIGEELEGLRDLWQNRD